MVNCNYVLLVISCILLNANSFQAKTCEETETSLSISAWRNNTGHWYSDVKMDFQSDGDKRQIAPQNLGVHFYSRRCDGKETLSIVTSIKVPAPIPGPGYKLFAGVGYYKLHTTKETWSDARRICTTEGGHLAILNSDIEANIVKQLFSLYKQANTWVFVGFHDEDTEGEFITIFDEPLQTTGYTKWVNGQPDNAGGIEDCGTVNIEAKLNDFPCNTKAPFICEYSLQ